MPTKGLMEKRNTILLSVVIPVYNAEEHINRCLESIINQNIDNIEIICVDDGSTDNSLNILFDYAKKYDYITVISQNNLYAGVARNNGLIKATGKYVHFMDADDFVIEGAYAKALRYLEQYDSDYLKMRCYAFDMNTGETLDIERYSLNNICKSAFGKRMSLYTHSEELLSVSVTPWSGIYKREFITRNNIAFDDTRYCNDLSFYIKTVSQTDNIYYADDFLVAHQLNNPNSLVGHGDKRAECLFTVFKRIYAFSASLTEELRIKIVSSIIKRTNWKLIVEKVDKGEIVSFFKNEKFSEIEDSALCSQSCFYLLKALGNSFWNIKNIQVNHIYSGEQLNYYGENDIFLYGAGSVLPSILNNCEEAGTLSMIKHIYVTKYENSARQIKNIDIKEFNEKNEYKNGQWIITTKEEFWPSIYYILINAGVKKIAVWDSGM